MGLMDSIKKIAKAAESVGKLLNEVSQTVQNNGSSGKSVQSDTAKPAASGDTPTAASSGSVSVTEQWVIDSADKAAKPSIEREDHYDKGHTFMLSGDFVEFDSHAEPDPCFQYEPNFVEDEYGFYTEYKAGLPVIAITPGFFPGDNIYDIADKFYQTGEMTGEEAELISESDFFAFKSRLYSRDGKYAAYCYFFKDIDILDHYVLGMQYGADLIGTPVEKKLLAALEEAAATYK